MVNSNGLKPWYAQSEPLLVAEDLRKMYGARVALQKLSFTLQAGHVLGFLGPNGAGKTTAIRVLTTMLEPTSGRFLVDGISSEHPEKIRRVIGVLPEGQGFPKHITGLDYLAYYAQLYGRSSGEAKKIGQVLLQDVGMQQRGNDLIGTYSHGMRQRLGIARALVNDPKVVFLDEPTLGLDPRGQHELLALIQRVAHERNTGVILSSHLLAEIEGICDDVVIMNLGEVVAKGTVAEVIGQTQLSTQQRNTLRIRVPPPAVAQAQEILAALPGIQQVTPADETAGLLAVDLAEPAGTPAAEDPLAKNRILEALIKAEIPILGFEIVGGRLQDVFLELTAEAIK